MKRIRKTAMELSPLIEKVLEKKPAAFTAPHMAAITDCLEKLKKGGSPELKKEIDWFIGCLADHQVISDLLFQ
jgi:hypothetical protein